MYLDQQAYCKALLIVLAQVEMAKAAEAAAGATAVSAMAGCRQRAVRVLGLLCRRCK